MTLLKWTRRNPHPLSDDTLSQLFNSLSDVVLVLNANHELLTINSSWKTITGVSVEASLQQTFTQFIHPEDRNNWTHSASNIVAATPKLIWLRILHTSGDYRWCEMRLQSMTENNRYPISATLCDITPQVRHDQVRAASHRSLQSLVNRLPAMLYRSRNNFSWTMEYVSEGCEVITGYSAENLLNQSQICLGSMIHADDAQYVWDAVQTALQLNQPFDLEYRLTQKNGQQIKVRDKGCGLYTDSNVVLGVEGIILQCR